MKVHEEVLQVRTPGQGFVDLSARLAEAVARSGVVTGLCVAFVQHTSASLVIQENADPAVRRDLARWLADLAPTTRAWEHDDEGEDDMPAHARSAVTRTSETIPVSGGRLALGTWQGLYLWEHRRAPHTRRVVVHVQGL
ncbi:MAG: secondary thiamine-phosphate synthase enzyme YjbQ [Planctomycetes bacterium]|nr:secondary thiamine-phosphate synthase enzyme YjbQ [Planctomycetota bacterium]